MHVRLLPSLLVVLVAALLAAPAQASDDEADRADDPGLLAWDDLPPLPDAVGFAGSFAGVSGGALLVAGGANFPGGPPWEGHAKVWHDEVFVLSAPEATWRRLENALPRPLGYGVSITVDEGVICIGGCDRERCSEEVFLLRWDEATETLAVTEGLSRAGFDGSGPVPLPALPVPLAFMSGALVEDAIYIAGGQASMEAGAPSTATFLRLDLARDGDGEALAWEALPWPDSAPPRILAVAAAQSDGRAPAFHLFSGRCVTPDGGVELLRDAWSFAPATGRWSRRADPPRCLMAGAAVPLGSDHVLVIGGDDGRDFGRDRRDAHPGFAPDMLFTYHAVTDTWAPRGTLPANHVTTPAVPWEGSIVIPSGEIRPGVRSSRVLRAAPARLEAGFTGLDHAVVALYLAALVAMGIYFSRREHSTEDFFLAGRRVPWWAAGMSIFGTQLSAITFMAIPALVYRTDWVYYTGQITIVIIAPVVVWIYLPFFRRLNVTTAYEYLERRFGLAVRLLASATFVLFQLGRMGIVLYLPALALSTVTGIDIYLSIALMGVLATVYTVLGGIEAVIWTDVLQVVVLLGGAGLSLVVIAGRVDGGLGGIVEMGAAHGKLRAVNLDWDFATTSIWVVLLGTLFGQLVPYTADQSVVQRYLTTADRKQAARSIWTNAVLTVPASLVFFSLGTALWAFYRTHPELLNPAGRSDDILPWFIATELPAGLAGLVIAGLFAASMSSLDSSMNSMATALTTDFYRRLRAGADDRSCLRLARVLTVLLGAVGVGCALYMAALQSKSMWDQYLKVMGLFGGGLAGLFALGIFSRRATGRGALVGFLASAVLLYAAQSSDRIHFFLYAGIGIGGAFVIGWIASVVLPGGERPLEGLTVYDRGAGERSPSPDA